MQSQQYSKERGLLGKLHPSEKKLEGKTFYLDNVKKRCTTLLLEAISLLGGRVESFLHKDVNFVVTGNQEGLNQEKKSLEANEGAKRTSDGAQHLTKERESDKPRPGTPRPMVCGSRGKALLEKAIRNNERLKGSSVLSNARSWGVKILYVEDVLLYLKQLTRESFTTKRKRPEVYTKQQQGSPAVKAVALRSPYLKIEDLSRKYKPLHMQSMTFPALCYSGRFSPFESPPPLFDKQEKETREKKAEGSVQDKSQTPLSYNPSPWRPRKKDLSYCECCHQPFASLEEHLQSDRHRAFVLDPTNFSMIDQLVAEMLPGFNPNPSQQSEETLNRPPTPVLVHDVCELEPLTDVETEHAVQALQRHCSSFSPLPFGAVSPSQGAKTAVPNPDTLPADIQPPGEDCKSPDILPRASSPVMPVLVSLNEQPENEDLPPSLRPASPLPKLWSLPPVLSPQVPYSSYVIDPYSDPPVLSPQKCPTEAGVEQPPCEMSAAEYVSELISNITFPLTDAEASNQGGGFGFNELCCKRGLECTMLSSRRSRSLPRESALATNPKKRCRSVSPEPSCRKRRRRCSGGWKGQSLESVKPQRVAKVESCLLFDKSLHHTETCPPTTCTVISSKQTFSLFCFPTPPSFIQAPNQIVAKTRDSSPALDKSHSQESSQRSQSLSTSVCIESALIPDLAALCPSSSESDWDHDLLTRLGPTTGPPAKTTPAEQNGDLDKELLHRPCPWMHDSSYESHLYTVLQPSAQAASLCGEEMDSAAFSRTMVQIVEVQH
ncbi:uncharacterized protein dbf4b isoform X2 [Mugil cephalus]|uniref:uncharacterized protein dbf4b isoform X2 n=1 Tax=Mugil cephalus TaxID=48193 RepID=UPI001FB6306C|nr:uncharacterized protein dbf4b isoform X2 [Mugil cephalus]